MIELKILYENLFNPLETDLGDAFETDCINKGDTFITDRKEQLTNIGQSGNFVQGEQQALPTAGKELKANVHSTALQTICISVALDQTENYAAATLSYNGKIHSLNITPSSLQRCWMLGRNKLNV